MLYNAYDKDGKIIRKIDKKQELSINENEWLKGVTCFVINENDGESQLYFALFESQSFVHFFGFDFES